MEFILSHKFGLIVTTALSAAFGLLLMGAPAMGITYATERFFLSSPFDPLRVHGDSVWPTMILYSMSMPWIYYATHLLLKHFLPAVPKVMIIALSVTATCAVIDGLYFSKYSFSKYPKNPPTSIESAE